MLTSVHIENIALIKNIDLDFGAGFNVLTGETGAGKSIVIDALSLLCGARGDREIIRTGADGAVVEGVFFINDKKLVDSLAAIEIEPDGEGNVYLRRQLTTDGRSTAKINFRQVPLTRLKEAASLLLSIHGQQDTQILADEQKQLELLDLYASNSGLVKKYRAEYEKYRDIKKQQKELLDAENEKEYRLDIIEYKLKEISAARLDPGEEKTLSAELNRLANSEKITQNANEAYDLLYRKNPSAAGNIASALNALNRLVEFIPELQEPAERLESVKYEVDDISETVGAYASADGEADYARLDRVEERLEQINYLKRKYKKSVEDLLDEYGRLSEEKETIKYSAEILKTLEKKLLLQKNLLDLSAAELSENRRAAAEGLAEKACGTLDFLDMPDVKFKMEFYGKEYSPDGTDAVAFLISANKGEEPKPISRIASGGELSRIMLALKNLPSEEKNGGTMIFDEIDSGISGKTSDKIGIKLKETSKQNNSQILCVTHSAQIAARADTHILIKKFEDGERISTSTEILDKNGRINELARIIGGVRVSETVFKTAGEMLDGAGID